MSITFETVDEAVDDNGVKILTHGMAGSGKTVLCATAGMSTIIISAEGGLLSLKKFLKAKPDFNKYIKIITIKSFKQLEETLDMFEDNVQLSDWLMLDSVSEIAEQILSSEKKESKDPRKAYGNLTDKMLDHMRSFRDLPGYNIHMTCKQVREVDSDTERTRFVPSFPGRQVGPAIPYLFDEVFAMRVEEEEDDDGDVVEYRTLQTSRDIHYEAKDRSGELDEFEPPNLNKILYKINPEYVLLKDRDPEEVKKASESKKKKGKKKKGKKGEKTSKNTGAKTRKAKPKMEKEDTKTEPVISTKKQYWQHPETGNLFTTNKGADISGALDNECAELTKLKYTKAEEALKKEQGD